MFVHVCACVQGVITTIVSDYVDLLVRIAHIIYNHPLYIYGHTLLGLNKKKSRQ